MVRIIESHRVDATTEYYVYAGLHDDTKPTTGGERTRIVGGVEETYTLAISTGSGFLEVDTGDVYFFDEEATPGQEWIKAGGDS